MEYLINGNKYEYNDHIIDNDTLRQSFNRLTDNTFGFNFENWYNQGYMTAAHNCRYNPCVLIHHNKIVANVSYNIINIEVNNEKKLYIQIGTVMTHKDYCGNGLATFIMNKVIDKWQGKCDCIYLFANDSVTNFYPKFGFVPCNEYCTSTFIAQPSSKNTVVEKLNMHNPKDLARFEFVYAQSNPYSALTMTDNFQLIMFYCGSFMADNVYYLPLYKTAAVVEYGENATVIYDIFGNGTAPLDHVVSALCCNHSKNVEFGFTANLTQHKHKLYKEDDCTLFIMQGSDNIFEQGQYRFPALSHA